VLLLLIANLINLGADLGAMGAALKLMVGGPVLVHIVAFAMLSCGLQIFARYKRYTSLLKWGCLALFTYVICAFVVDVSWDKVGWAIVWPPLSINADYLMAIVAVFGTTISPYLFFWQAGQEVEETKEDPDARPLIRAPGQAEGEFNRIRIDTYIGMGISNFVALCIVITTAAALNAKGVTEIQTSAQAAEALRAVAGPLTFAVFAAGIIGTGMLALPALAGSAAYALGETLSWRVGLARAPRRAKAFYATIAVGMLLGVALNFSPIDPIKALYWSAVLNGVVAVPLMVTMMFMTMRRSVMAGFTLTPALQIMGWLATATMATTAVAMIWSWLK
jgi:Mn2+/Fe2+ NRAMP family transporter